jgi:hypothetical protein
MELIEAAIAKYYDSIGLETHQYSHYRRSFADAHEVYDPYGKVIETKDPDAPRAAQLGYKFLGVGEDGREMWAKPGVSPHREIFDRNGRRRDPYDSPYDPRGRKSRKHKDFLRVDGRMAEFARDKYGEQAEMYTRQASKPGKEKFGAIGSRGSRETDYRAGMKYSDPALDRVLRATYGKKKRQRTWIEKLNARMEGER